jgi:hypothetical protein
VEEEKRPEMTEPERFVRESRIGKCRGALKLGRGLSGGYPEKGKRDVEKSDGKSERDNEFG